MPLNKDELHELQTLRTCPLPMSGKDLQRYIELAYANEQDFHRELAPG